MIQYPYGAFGFQILCRLRGSAVFKSLLPALISSCVYVALYHVLDLHEEKEFGEVGIMDHPYPMGALIAAFTYLLSFRANFAYNRYWEAFTSVHSMHSKWLDVGTDLAAFHLQAARYNDNKPPTFGENPHLTSLEREREFHEKTFQEIKDQIHETCDNNLEQDASASRWTKFWSRRRKNRRTKTASQLRREATQLPQAEEETSEKGVLKNRKTERQASILIREAKKPTVKSINAPKQQRTKRNKKKKGPHRRVVSTLPTNDDVNGVHRPEMEKRPLFLQEAAHLLSLLSAVAMSTLRNDLETTASPLVPFTPGAPFPCVDPDGMTADIREDWEINPNKNFATVRYFLGLNRSETDRALYNAARPFRVVGGVSDNEILLLQAARGPQAKLNLVAFWLQEFISREILAGSVGKVAPPILSRLFQYVSDGCLHYNQARKVAYIPFPFPHAQITSIFVLVIVVMIPVLMLTFVNNEFVGFCLNLFTVMCFAGLHEVSRELENPFQNAPNDLPANNFHAQFNEALMSMFAGYHPDAYWVVKEDGDEMTDSSKLENLENLGEMVAAIQNNGTSQGEEVARADQSTNCSDGEKTNPGSNLRVHWPMHDPVQQEPVAIIADSASAPPPQSTDGGDDANNTEDSTRVDWRRDAVEHNAWLSAFRGSHTAPNTSDTA